MFDVIHIRIKHVVHMTLKLVQCQYIYLARGHNKHMITTIFLFDSQCRNLGAYMQDTCMHVKTQN